MQASFDRVWSMKAIVIQQALAGFNTVSVHGAPMIVRVHEALDSCLTGLKYRYFVSVDFKFKEIDALHIGNPGHWGMTRAEAEKCARELAAKIVVFCGIVNRLETSTEKHAAMTLKIQKASLEKIVGRYKAEFV